VRTDVGTGVPIANHERVEDARLNQLRAIINLREMLHRTILEQHALCDVDFERAVHLQDAVNDLRTIIARLESRRGTDNDDSRQ
jgi:hypothetical protein